MSAENNAKVIEDTLIDVLEELSKSMGKRIKEAKDDNDLKSTIQEVADKVSNTFDELYLNAQPYEYMVEKMADQYMYNDNFSMEIFKNDFYLEHQKDFDEVVKNMPMTDEGRENFNKFLDRIDGSSIDDFSDNIINATKYMKGNNVQVYRDVAIDLKLMDEKEMKDQVKLQGHDLLDKYIEKHTDEKQVSKDLLNIQDKKGVLNMSTEELANITHQAFKQNLDDEVKLSFDAVLKKFDIKEAVTKMGGTIILNKEPYDLTSYNTSENIKKNLDNTKEAFKKFDSERSDRYLKEREKLSKDKYVFVDKVNSKKYQTITNRYQSDLKNIDNKYAEVQKTILKLNDPVKINETMEKAAEAYKKSTELADQRYYEQKEGLKKLDKGIYDKDSIPFVNIFDPNSRDVVKKFMEKASKDDVIECMQKTGRMYEELDKDLAENFIGVFASEREDFKEINEVLGKENKEIVKENKNRDLVREKEK